MKFDFLTALQVLILIGSFSAMILLLIFWKRTENRLAKNAYQFFALFFLILTGSFIGNWFILLISRLYSISFDVNFSFQGYPQLFRVVFPIILLLSLFSPALLLPVVYNFLSNLFGEKIPPIFIRTARILPFILIPANAILVTIYYFLDFKGLPMELFHSLEQVLVALLTLLLYGGLGGAGLLALRYMGTLEDKNIKSILKSFLILIAVFLPILIFEQILNTYLSLTSLGLWVYRYFPMGIGAHWLFFLALTILTHVKIIDALIHQGKGTNTDPFAGPLKRIREEGSLTPREQEVVELTITGISNKEIALKLEISHATVKNHLTNAYRKLDVSSRWDLLRRV